MPAASMKISAAKWPGLPLPALLKFRPLPLPCAIKSLRVLKPVLGCAPTSRPEDTMTMMGRRSAGLNAMFL